MADQPGEVEIGRMRHRVTLLATAYGPPDGSGQRARTYTTLAEVWGMVEYLPGTEVWQGDRAVRMREATVTVRYLDGVQGNTRLRVDQDATVWNVESARDHDGKKRFLVLEVRAQGG
jgi:head-tail adaptor